MGGLGTSDVDKGLHLGRALQEEGMVVTGDLGKLGKAGRPVSSEGGGGCGTWGPCQAW